MSFGLSQIEWVLVPSPPRREDFLQTKKPWLSTEPVDSKVPDKSYPVD